jgi:hypothetical protein
VEETFKKHLKQRGFTFKLIGMKDGVKVYSVKYSRWKMDVPLSVPEILQLIEERKLTPEGVRDYVESRKK